ncbi:MAG TPA: hypothetical protein VEY92_02435 [Pseudoxanthomonas sp.]|nr:hypothetical protein [Pseudoxanthomonas sp.]
MTLALPAAGLRVIAAGAVTSVGNTLPSTTAALNAALDNFADTHFYDDVGEALSGAALSLPLPPQSEPGTRIGGAEKLSQALSWAVEECLTVAGVALPLPVRVPLLFLADDTRPVPLVETVHLCDVIGARFFAQPDRLAMRAYTAGEVACVQALRVAGDHIAAGAPYVLLAAVDSWLRVPDINQGLRQRRLLCNDNAFGFVPGEGAAAVLLAGPRSPRPAGGPVLHLRGLGLAEEAVHLFSDEPCYGRGMAAAIREALAEAGWAPHDVNLRLSDSAGEAYFSEELTYAWGRVLREAQPPGNDYIQVATRTGHVGVAFGPLLLAHLWQLAQMKQVPGPHALIHLSSAQSLRGTIAAGIE